MQCNECPPTLLPWQPVRGDKLNEAAGADRSRATSSWLGMTSLTLPSGLSFQEFAGILAGRDNRRDFRTTLCIVHALGDVLQGKDIPG
jgi:hypothetical protein